MKASDIDEVCNGTNSPFKWRFWFVVIQKFCYHSNVMKQLLLSIALWDCFEDAVASFIGYHQIVRENGPNLFP